MLSGVIHITMQNGGKYYVKLLGKSSSELYIWNKANLQACTFDVAPHFITSIDAVTLNEYPLQKSVYVSNCRPNTSR